MVRNSSRFSKCGLIARVVAFLLATAGPWAQAEEYRSPSDGIHSLSVERGLLSLDARDASLEKLLRELARMAMLTVVSDGPIEGKVTVYADRLPLEKALRRILRGKDTSLVYTAKAKTSPKEYEVTEVRIYVAKEGSGESQRYSFANRRLDTAGERARQTGPSRTDSGPSRSRGPVLRPPAQAPGQPPAEMPEEARALLSALVEGDLDGLDAIAEKLKDQSPQVQEQLDEFLNSLEEVRRKAEESGLPMTSPMEGLGDVQSLMKQMIERGRMPAGGGRE
jgi:hypothetical protein